MNSFSTQRQVQFTPQQMFDLVADVEKYPQFLPLCEALTVRKRTVDAAGREVLVADMECGYKSIRERFTSRVTLDASKHHILVEYVDGPFRRLENNWRFLPNPTGCDVNFQIAYEFKSRMLQMLVGGLFDKAFRKFAEAFEQRAMKVYGRQPKTDERVSPLMPSAATTTGQ